MSANQAPSTGTTIVACTYPGGVVLAADGRVSIGRYVSNRASNKIAEIMEKVFYLRSGSAPDTQAVAEVGALRGALPEAMHAQLRAHTQWLPCFALPMCHSF